MKNEMNFELWRAIQKWQRAKAGSPECMQAAKEIDSIFEAATNQTNSERDLFERAREKGTFKPPLECCPTWYATELRFEGWKAHSDFIAHKAPPQPQTVYATNDFDEIASQHADATYCVGDTFKYFEFTPEQLRKFVEAVLIHYEVDHIYKIKENKK